jgi:ABC-2 type transport system permease protein
VIRLPIVLAIVRREWLEIMRNRLLLFAVLVPPAILIALPVGILVSGQAPSIGPDALARLMAGHPEWAGFSPRQVFAAMGLQQFVLLFLLMPGYIPLAITAYSIVGEKQSRTLEAVLVTPIRTVELLAGKAAAAAVPGVAAAWLAYAVLVSVAAVMLGSPIVATMTGPVWYSAVFALGPAIGLFAVVAGMMISSRVNDPRAAQQLGMVVMLPLIALIVSQSATGFLSGPTAYLDVAAAVAAVGIVGVRFSVRLFGRESILTRWR